MTINIDGVPAEITRTAYIEMIESLGFDPSSLKQITFHVKGVHAVVIAKNENGNDIIDPIDPNEIATHQVYIPVRP